MYDTSAEQSVGIIIKRRALMSTMYDSLMKSLSEEVEDIEVYGKSQGKKTAYEVLPPTIYSAEEVKSIRKKSGYSQSVFAKCLGVSKKTVEAWEEGVNTPSGPALRILSLIYNNSISIEQFIVH